MDWEDVVWIHLTLDSDRWLAVVYTAINLHAP